jgi:hypothetical protein
MSVTVPEGMRWFFRTVVGEDWPIGDEDQMRKLAAVWDAFASLLDGLEQEIIAGRLRLRHAAMGSWAPAFAAGCESAPLAPLTRPVVWAIGNRRSHDGGR